MKHSVLIRLMNDGEIIGGIPPKTVVLSVAKGAMTIEGGPLVWAPMSAATITSAALYREDGTLLMDLPLASPSSVLSGDSLSLSLPPLPSALGDPEPEEPSHTIVLPVGDIPGYVLRGD